MGDRVSELTNHNELKFSREQGFFDKSIGIRILIGVIFIFSLFFFLHFREVRVDVLELNSLATRYIVAQTDVNFFDEEMTELHKQEAVRDLGKIYLISDRDVQMARKEFEEFLIQDQGWREELKKSTFEEIYKGVEAIEKELTHLHLTDPRTHQKMRELKLSVDYYQVYTVIDLDIPAKLPKRIWRAIADKALPPDQFNSGTVEFILRHFRGKEWTLKEDTSAYTELMKYAESNIPDKYTNISAGSRLIDEGERVTARHIAILQSMKEAVAQKRNLWHPSTLAGSFAMTLILTSIAVAFFSATQPQVLYSNRKMFLLVTIIILTFIVSKITEYFLLTSNSQLVEAVRYPLFVPFAAILLCSLLNTTVATYASGFLIVVMSMALAVEGQEFMVMNISAALVAILTTHSLKQRKEIFVVCGKAWLACAAVILSAHLYQNSGWNGVVGDLSSTGVFMLMTAVFVVGMLPLLESTFGIMTDVTLMEYMDPNNDLLRRLTIEAPGTYQHSVVVGNLAEAAALAIGANGLFCRVSTLYHDIGKMATPQYFTENQQGEMNIHQLLTPLESAQVIIAHVSEGVVMARKAGLPEQFIDTIKEHHGTTLVYYFYRKQLEKVGGDKSLVEEKDFRYSGPKPRSKESAIIMIADSLEAAGRTLEIVDESSVDELTESIIKCKMDDGQFDHCLLTCEELAMVKRTLVKTLVASSHSRIKYPDKRDE